MSSVTAFSVVFTDTLPTNYRCYLDRLSVDLLTDKKTPLDQNVSRYSANTRLASRSRVDQVLANIAANISINSPPKDT